MAVTTLRLAVHPVEIDILIHQKTCVFRMSRGVNGRAMDERSVNNSANSIGIERARNLRHIAHIEYPTAWYNANVAVSLFQWKCEAKLLDQNSEHDYEMLYGHVYRGDYIFCLLLCDIRQWFTCFQKWINISHPTVTYIIMKWRFLSETNYLVLRSLIQLSHQLHALISTRRFT